MNSSNASDGETSLLPLALREAVEAALGSRISGAVEVGGGEICRAVQLQTGDGAFFLKWRDAAPPLFFQREAESLSALRATNTLRVPEVVAFAEKSDAPAFLVLEWIEERIIFDKPRFAREFGESLAALHRHSAERYGFETDNYLGVFAQLNGWRDSWRDFFRDNRLMPQIEIARSRGLLTGGREHLLLGIVDNLDTLLGGFNSAPSLLHGDLWSGNYLVGERAALVDPAAYYGERECEIAYAQLFGGFPRGFFEAYNEAWPLDEGFERRRGLHQLYHLLVHLNHFGERYGDDVDRVCHVYVR